MMQPVIREHFPTNNQSDDDPHCRNTEAQCESVSPNRVTQRVAKNVDELEQ